MTPQEIQSYSLKCAELMGWAYDPELILSDRRYGNHKGCFVMKNRHSKRVEDFEYHLSYSEQIPVWQKVYAKLIGKIYNEDTAPSHEMVVGSGNLIRQYKQSICTGTPLDSFAILCKATDLIETKK